MDLSSILHLLSLYLTDKCPCIVAVLEKTPMMAVFVTMTRFVVMANIMKMAMMSFMECYEFKSSVVYMGAFLKRSKNAENSLYIEVTDNKHNLGCVSSGRVQS